MAYNQKNQAGRGNMMKTGRNIPDTFKGPQMAQDGPGDGIIDNIKSAVSSVADRISTAHQRGYNEYRQNYSTGSTLGDMGSTSGTGRGSRNYDPTNYVSGFVKGLVTGEPASKKKKK